MNDSNGPSTLERLREGNRRFALGEARRLVSEQVERRSQLASGQAPHAVVLTCADSRVPPELIFDQGLGELFVIRVAGNVVSPTQLGSIEYAVEVLGTRLVIVLGHTGCGAVTAALDELLFPSPGLSPNLRALTERIRPAVEAALAARAVSGGGDQALTLSDADREEVIADAIRRNVRVSVAALREESGLLDHLARTDGLVLTGAEYDLEDGSVSFLD